MRNLLTWILVAAVAILGFFATQSAQQVSGLQADVAARTEAATALAGEKASLTAEIEKLKTESAAALKSANDSVASLESEKSALADQVSGLLSEKASLGEQLTGLQAELSAVTEQVGALEAERASLNDQIAALRAQVEAATAAPATGGTTNP